MAAGHDAALARLPGFAFGGGFGRCCHIVGWVEELDLAQAPRPALYLLPHQSTPTCGMYSLGLHIGRKTMMSVPSLGAVSIGIHPFASGALIADHPAQMLLYRRAQPNRLLQLGHRHETEHGRSGWLR